MKRKELSGRVLGPSCTYGQKNFIQKVEGRKEIKSVVCLSFTVKLLCTDYTEAISSHDVHTSCQFSATLGLFGSQVKEAVQIIQN